MHDQVREFGQMKINLDRREVRNEDAFVHLTKSEFGVLAVLTSQPGQAFTREQIITQSKGDDYPVTGRSIDVHVVGLRRKLGRLGGRIQTVRGVGYQFLDAASAAECVEEPIEPSPQPPTD
jgi:two-component system, OmpR family, alkaline phosphatase synthesis response regulator PhoP